MFTEELFDSTIIVCTPAEARSLWNSSPADRPRIWTLDEYQLAGLLGPEELKAIVEKKKDPKGFVYKG